MLTSFGREDINITVILHVIPQLIMKYFETPSASVARIVSHDPLGGSFNALP